jgi:hypothetical protein
MLAKAREYSIGMYSRKVAAVFQQMVRAEAAAEPAGGVFAIIGGKVRLVYRQVGQCVCVTCGKVAPWKGDYIGGGKMDTGHFPASRRASILFEPHAVHPQCKHCNRHLHGNEGNYEVWVQHVYGDEEVARLKRLKHEIRRFTRGELVDMKLAFTARLTIAKEQIARGAVCEIP